MRPSADDTWIIPQTLERSTLEALLAQHFDLQLLPEYRATVTYMDSFDWRLYQAGMLLHVHHRAWTLYEKSGELTLLKGGPQCTRSCLVDAFPEGAMRNVLAPVLGVRALLPVARVNVQGRQLNLRDARGVIMLRLVLEEQQVAGREEPLRMARLFPAGDNRREQAAVHSLLRELGIVEPISPLAGFEAGCRAEGRSPLDYQPKGVLPLQPDMDAQEAVRLGCRQLLTTMRRNLPGVLADLDSEFLHDLRVALRRTRSILAQSKAVLGADNLRPLQQGLAELARATGTVRNLDVSLLGRRSCHDRLHPALRAGLREHFAALVRRRRSARRTMLRFFGSVQVEELVQVWEAFLEKGPDPVESLAAEPVLSLANRIIRKGHQRLLTAVRGLDADSPDAELHRLRITCKKLRYSMEFFSALYPQEPFSRLLLPLKEAQGLLGTCNDLAVQQQFLQDTLAQDNTGGDRVAALAALIQSLYEEQQQVRRRCLETCAALDSGRRQQLVTELFGGKKRG